MNPLVSIILVAHNGMDHIQKCLDSVIRQAYENIEIILVDNASTDGTADFVKEHYPQVRQIRNKKNLAYGPGNDVGVSIAEGDLLLFLNHDTLVTDDFLLELIRAMEGDPEIAVAQSLIMMTTDPEIIDSAGAFLTWTGMWFHPGRGEPIAYNGTEPVDVLGAAGACVLVRMAIYKKLQGFDPDFRIYFDDADFSWRARLIGNRVVMVPKSVIYHWGGATTQKMPSAFTVFHSFKNRFCSLIKLLSLRDLIWVLPVHLTICLAASAAYALSLKPANAYAILRALWWNLTNVRRTLNKRKEFTGGLGAAPKHIFEDYRKPLPVSWFMRTSMDYFSRW